MVGLSMVVDWFVLAFLLENYFDLNDENTSFCTPGWGQSRVVVKI